MTNEQIYIYQSTWVKFTCHWCNFLNLGLPHNPFLGRAGYHAQWYDWKHRCRLGRRTVFSQRGMLIREYNICTGNNIYIYIYLYVDSQRAAELKHPKLMKILICYVFALPRAAQVRWKQFGDCCRASQSNQGSTEIAIGWSFIWRGSMRIVAWYWSYIAMSVRKTNKNICIIYIVLPPPHLRWIWISSGTHMRHLAILGDTRVLA